MVFSKEIYGKVTKKVYTAMFYLFKIEGRVLNFMRSLNGAKRRHLHLHKFEKISFIF